jgi:hypothetical protein
MALYRNSRYDRGAWTSGTVNRTGAKCMRRYVISNLLGLVGAALGGVLGFYTYCWIVSKGMVGGMIPGAFLGLGCSLLARHSSFARGVVCGVAGLVLGFFADWKTNVTTDTFLEYLQDVKNVNQVILLMILLGAAIAFWLGKDAGALMRSRRDEASTAPVPPPQPDHGKTV